MGPLPIDSTSATPPTSTSLSPRQEIEKKLQSLAAQANETPSGNTITQEELIEPLQRINEVMRPRGLEFDISEESSRIITRVVDRDTGDVIRQIPAEEVLLLAEQLEEMQGRLISVEA